MESTPYLSFFPRGDFPRNRTELIDYENQLRASAALSYGVAKENYARSIMLFGMPGTGKSVFPLALARQMNEDFRMHFSLAIVKCDYLLGSKNLAKEIDMIARIVNLSEKYRPSIIAFDEIDTFSVPVEKASSETAMLTRFMRDLMADQPLGTLLIGITNYPDQVDASVLRRFNSIIYMEPADVRIAEEIVRRTFNRGDSRELATQLWDKLDKLGFVPFSYDIIRACKLARDYTAKEHLQPSTGQMIEILQAFQPGGVLKTHVENYKESNSSLIKRSEEQQAYWIKVYEEAIARSNR